jgi:hypothetical protein
MPSTLESDKYSSVRTVSLTLFIVNVIGAISYVVRASPSWAIPQERGLHSMTGEPFVWASFVLPIVAAFALTESPLGSIYLFQQKVAKRLLLADDSHGVAHRCMD